MILAVKITPNEKILFTIFTLTSFVAFSQNDTQSGLYVNNFKTYGYIDGKRFDSINAEYAGFSLRTNNLLFDYGQFHDWGEDLKVTESNGTAIQFANLSFTFALNFLYYNEWQLEPNSGMNADGYYIMKKRALQN